MSAPAKTFRVEAVVLTHFEIGEADRILSLFTRDSTKLRAIAKGIRKIHSRKAGHLEPFTRVNLLLTRGRDLLIINQAETIEAYTRLREDLITLGLASYVVEVLDRFTYDGGENPGLYRLLVNTLTRLCTYPDPLLVLRYYEVNLLDILGFRPQLVNCVSCGREIQPVNQYLSAGGGGVYCPGCGTNSFEAHPVSLQALKYIRYFQRSNFKQASVARPTKEIHLEMEKLMEYYITYFLERQLNTPSFLRDVQKLT